MNELALKYGCNPNQKPSRIYMEDGSDLPVTVLNGKPGYINFLDALNSIQLVFELKKALAMPAAASFKHVSPAGAAIGLPLTDVERQMYPVAPDLELAPPARASPPARGAARVSPFGYWTALRYGRAVPTAKLIQHEVSDGIIAPGYEPEALAILAGKKKGNYNVVAIDPAYRPAPIEHKQVYGITFEQGRNDLEINAATMLSNFVTENKTVTEEQKRDLVISLITLKYTQSNSVCYVAGGQTIGVGAGQQSRIHCTRLAGQKADNWQLRHMDKVLNLPFRDDVSKPNRDNAIDVYIGDTPEDVIGDDVWAETFTRQPEPLTAEEKKEYLSHVTGVCLGSDAFFPFGDNIERARRRGVTAIVQPGGSIRGQQVIDTRNKYGIAMAFCGLRLFHLCGGIGGARYENSGSRRRRPRASHHPRSETEPGLHRDLVRARQRRHRLRRPVQGHQGHRRGGHGGLCQSGAVRLCGGGAGRSPGPGHGGRPGRSGHPCLWPQQGRRPHRGVQGVCQGPDEEIRHPHRRL